MSPILSTDHLTVRFRGHDALIDANLEIQPGRVFALLGENGAGKTTLIRVLTGFLAPTSGSCQVLGLDPVTQTDELRQRIGYVSDAPGLYDWMRIGQIGWFASSFYEEGFLDRYHASIAKYKLLEAKKIKELSKGQRAKVALSLAIAHDPELLILDEPTSGLDPIVRREFLESMVDRVAKGRTVLLSTHQIDEVQRVADDVAIIHEGRVKVSESLEALKADSVVVTVSVDDPLREIPILPSSANVLSETTNGRQRRLIVRGMTPTMQADLESAPGVVNVRVTSVDIDDLFLAYSRASETERAMPVDPMSGGDKETPAEEHAA